MKFLGLKGWSLTAAIAVEASTGFLLFGYDQGLMSGILTDRQFLITFPQTDTSTGNYHNSLIQALTTAIYEVGALLGSIFILIWGDKLGRRKGIFIGAAIMVIGAIIMTSSYSLGQFIVGRIVTGIGNGMNTGTIPTWQSELSSPKRRGLLVMLEGMLIAGGIMIAYWVGFGTYFVETSSFQWRMPVAVQIVFALAVLLGILVLPESPRWLIKKGRYEEARQVLAALEGKALDDPQAVSNFEEAKHSVEAQMGDQAFSYKELFTNGPTQHFRRFTISWVAQAFQQLSGINIITYYATILFEEYIGLSPTLSRLLAALNGTEYFIVATIAIFLIDIFGRRKLMLFGATGMSLTMVFLTVTFYFAQTEKNTSRGHSSSIGAAVLLFVFNSFFAIGWLGMTWLYPAEITPLRIRAQANAVSTCSNWIWNFVIVMISPPGQTSLGYKFYIIFAIFNACFVPVVYFFFPETSGRSLEEMDVIFAKGFNEGRNPVWIANEMDTLRGKKLMDTMTHEFAIAEERTGSGLEKAELKRELEQDRGSSESPIETAEAGGSSEEGVERRQEEQ